MRSPAKLGGCALCGQGARGILFPVEREREGAHTRLGLETIKVSGIDLKRREVTRAEEGGASGNVRPAFCCRRVVTSGAFN